MVWLICKRLGKTWEPTALRVFIGPDAEQDCKNTVVAMNRMSMNRYKAVCFIPKEGQL